MKRDHVASLVVLVSAAAILIAAWITSSPGFWPAVLSGCTAPVIAVLFTRWMRQFQDERFTQIYNLAARNAFVFLLFALPYIGAILAIQSVAVEAVGMILLVWFISLAIAYTSGYYYYKKY
ncbi:MAG: hypothetical protein JSW61_01095 [Candidatus Thorarchaeota archaeon]|nr:MAG: hypothetical protein JSW61_01095 [Candidatus Thorarchaeota archaeon]